MNDAVGQYIKHIQYERKFSEHTIREYSSDIRLFVQFLRNNRDYQEPLSATSQDVRDWLLYLTESKASRTTIHRRISSLKSFYKYHQKYGRIKKNPALNLLLPKKTTQLPTFVEEKQIDQLLQAGSPTSNYQELRKITILITLYLTGIRRSELINLKISDIDQQRNYISVTGKRNKQRNIPIPTWFTQHISIYIESRNTTIQTKYNNLFVTDKGYPLYPKYVYNIVRQTLTNYTTQSKRSPHTLRHTFATHMLNAGADLNAIRELLGHTSLAATQVYTHNNFEKLKKTYKQAHPRD